MKLQEILKEIGFSAKSGYGFPYERVSASEYTAKYEFSTGDNKYRVYIVRDENDEIQEGLILHIAFSVVKSTYVPLPGIKKKLDMDDFDTEVNDPKNVYRVMATVVNISKEEMERLKKLGENVARIEFEPKKRSVVNPKTGLNMDDPKDERRANLYLAYLKKEFPGAEIKSTANKEKIWVDIIS